MSSSKDPNANPGSSDEKMSGHNPSMDNDKIEMLKKELNDIEQPAGEKSALESKPLGFDTSLVHKVGTGAQGEEEVDQNYQFYKEYCRIYYANIILTNRL